MAFFQNFNWLPPFLFSALIGSWVFFFAAWLAGRGARVGAVRRAEDARRQLRDEISGVGAIMELLNDIHESSLEQSGPEGRPTLARLILEAACRIAKCQNGALFLIDKETGDLVLFAAKGSADKPAGRVRVGEGVAGLAAETGKTLSVDNIDTDGRFLDRPGVDRRFKSQTAVPLRIKNRVVGVAAVCAEPPHHVFEERNVRLLELLAGQAAITLENLESYENLQTFYIEMVETLARALELKENVVKEDLHYERSRTLAREISRELNLPESIVRHIEFASLINGIGKIAIDDAILRKPGKLTPEEYEQIKKHPEIGKRILAQVKFLSPVTSMVLYHQERWDGKGYPAGLKGEEIPLGSRIVAVINAYHAMISDRPYRKALSQAEAIEELKGGAGSQFDPKVVEAFVQVLRRVGRNAGGKTHPDA